MIFFRYLFKPVSERDIESWKGEIDNWDIDSAAAEKGATARRKGSLNSHRVDKNIILVNFSSTWLILKKEIV